MAVHACFGSVACHEFESCARSIGRPGRGGGDEVPGRQQPGGKRPLRGHDARQARGMLSPGYCRSRPSLRTHAAPTRSFPSRPARPPCLSCAQAMTTQAAWR